DGGGAVIGVERWARAINNTLTIDGIGVAGNAVVSNGSALVVGTNSLTASFNSVTLTNGGQLFTAGASFIGGVSNAMTVLGGAARSEERRVGTAQRSSDAR